MPADSSELLTRARHWAVRARARSRRVILQEPVVSTGDRLVPAPVFVLSSVRSGSTLLRAMLNAHSEIHAPHELHLRDIHVEFAPGFGRAAMAELGLNREELQFLLWDRVLQRTLAESGKSVLVEKTPGNVFQWRKILRCWPDARFVFLLRHPGSIVDSWVRARRRQPMETFVAEVLRYAEAVERARRRRPGITVRYEDLTADPEHELRRLCEFIGVTFEPGMINYSADDPTFRVGIGDWSDKLRSGRVQPGKPPPPAHELAPDLVPIARAWGYLD